MLLYHVKFNMFLRSYKYEDVYSRTNQQNRYRVPYHDAVLVHPVDMTTTLIINIAMDV